MNYYDVTSNSYNELYKEEQLNKLSIIKNHIRMNKNAKLLDVGCGTGISSDFDCFVVGIDSSVGLLKQNKNIKLLCVAESLPFKSNVFDYVISISSIHNFKDIKKAISEMKRVGKNKFVLSVLKKSRRFNYISNIIEKNFKVEKAIREDKDLILFLKT